MNLGVGSGSKNNITMTDGKTDITGGLVRPFATASYLGQTSTTPFIGGTYFSAFEATGITQGTSYAPFSTTAGWNVYSGTQWNGNGGITLPQGAYLCWMSLNIDGSTTAITDMRMGLLTRSTTPTATETDWTDSLPYMYRAVAGSPRNYTVYTHKTDSNDNSPNDTEQTNLSGCVYVSGTDILYPWVRWNKGSATSDLRGNVIFTRIGL
jgi:hypothetical protein